MKNEFRVFNKKTKTYSGPFTFQRLENSKEGMIPVMYKEDYLDNSLGEDNINDFIIEQWTGEIKNGSKVFERL